MQRIPAPPGVRWLNRKQAAIYLTERGCHVTHRTLEKLANKDNSLSGPAFYRNGGNRVIYSTDDLDAWRNRRMVRVE